ncbi:MAG TPA: response regulator transcription factor [Opitutaceae bacterium]|jgi:DNA-binding NarL/FixJ family response regulator
MRVAIIDDHLAIGEMMLEVVADAGYSAVGCASSLASGLELCARERPDLVVLDLGLGDDSGLALLPRLRRCCPAARVIIFSGRLKPSAVRRALAAGANGVVDKQASLDEVQTALRTVAAGGTYYSRQAEDSLHAPRPRVVRLSERDRAVLAALAEGLSSKEISDRLGLTSHVVNNLRRRLMQRVQLRGTAQLVRFAVGAGLVSDEVPGAAEITAPESADT